MNQQNPIGVVMMFINFAGTFVNDIDLDLDLEIRNYRMLEFRF